MDNGTRGWGDDVLASLPSPSNMFGIERITIRRHLEKIYEVLELWWDVPPAQIKQSLPHHFG